MLIQGFLIMTSSTDNLGLSSHAISRLLRIHWRSSAILKTSNKNVWSNIFRYIKVYIFWRFIQNTIYWIEIKMLKIFPSDKINVTKNTLFFLSTAPTHHSFTFNSQFLYELKHKVRLPKTVMGFSIFDSVSFLLKLAFLFNKRHGLFGFKTS